MGRGIDGGVDTGAGIGVLGISRVEVAGGAAEIVVVEVGWPGVVGDVMPPSLLGLR